MSLRVRSARALTPGMAAKRGSAEYAMEKAAAVQQRALQATNKARFLEVVEALKASSDATNECRVLLVNMGLLKPLPGQVVAPPVPVKVEKKEPADDDADGVCESGIDGVPYPDGVSDKLPDKIRVIKDLSQP